MVIILRGLVENTINNNNNNINLKKKVDKLELFLELIETNPF